MRETGGDCYSTPDYIAERRQTFYAFATESQIAQQTGVIATLGRSPYPSIRGPFPVDKKRPWLDLRRIEGE